MGLVICVEGLIGQGKTTLVEKLNGTKYLEPVESNPFLEDYYSDPKRWAYAMQVNLLSERFAMFQRAQWETWNAQDTEHDAILDRSFYGDWAFAEVQRDLGYMTDKEFDSYKRLHRVHQHFLQFPDLILRLDCPIETTMSRIEERARGCETGISQDYIQRLSDAYDTLFEELERKTCVVRLDATKSPSEVLADAIAAIKWRRSLNVGNQYPHYNGGH